MMIKCYFLIGPTLISELDGYRVVTASVGRKHSLFLTDKGQVFACGDNSSRQCGVKGKNTLKKPELIVYDGPPAVEIACGGDFSGLVDVSGGCWMFGSPNQGQWYVLCNEYDSKNYLSTCLSLCMCNVCNCPQPHFSAETILTESTSKRQEKKVSIWSKHH